MPTLSSKMHTSVPSMSPSNMETINSRWIFGLLAMLASYCQGDSIKSDREVGKLILKITRL